MLRYLRALGMAMLSAWGLAGIAQVTTGTISGTVKDSSGAVLPGAKVVILNEDTGISRTAQADAGGRYSAPSLSLGSYRVTASQEGFQSETRTGFVLTVGREAVVDFQGVAKFDMGLTKNTRLTERCNLQFRAEAFNLFNRANFSHPSSSVFSSSGSRVGRAGLISATLSSAPSRQI